MPTTTAAEAAVSDGADRQQPPRRGALSGAKGIAAALVACWLLPVITHLLRIDIVLPVVILALTASLLRSGRTILDRLVIAIALLFGATCVGGLLLSVWPWHLHPIAVSGTALTVLVGIALVTKRRPRLPKIATWADIATIGYTGFATAVAAYPLLGRGFSGRLSVLAYGNDLARHFMVYDTIRISGGFMFLNKETARLYVESGFEGYMQGSHLVSALLANHWQSTARAGDAMAGFDLYIWLSVLTFSFLALSVLWAARRVAGPALSGPMSFLLLGAVAAFCTFDAPITLLTRGFPAESAGAALLALLLGIVIRPLHRTREQIFTVAALLIAISFTYYLFLPFAGLATLGWLWLHRRRLRKHRPLAIGAAVAIAGLSVITPVANLIFTPRSASAVLLLGGLVEKVHRHVVSALVLVILAALIPRVLRRATAWRATAYVVVLAAGLAFGFRAYQLRYLGRTEYYFEKMLHQLLIALMVAAGVLAFTLHRRMIEIGKGQPAWRRRLIPLAPGAVLLAAVFFAFGAVGDRTYTSPGYEHLSRKKAQWNVGTATAETVKRFPGGNDQRPGDGKVTFVFTDDEWSLNATVYTAVLQRNYPRARNAYWWMGYWPKPKTEADLEEFILDYSPASPVRAVTNAPNALAALKRIASRHPEAGLEIVELPKFAKVK